MLTTHAAECHDTYNLIEIHADDTQQSGPAHVCFSCRVGRLHAKPLVRCTLKHRYLRSLTREFMCFMCLERTFRVPPHQLADTRRRYAQSRNRVHYSRLFDYIDVVEHPDIRTALEYHERGHTIPPHVASAALSVALVYAKDVELRDNYTWLIAHADEFELTYLRERHAGVGGKWPTREERATVTAARQRCETTPRYAVDPSPLAEPSTARPSPPQ